MKRKLTDGDISPRDAEIKGNRAMDKKYGKKKKSKGLEEEEMNSKYVAPKGTAFDRLIDADLFDENKHNKKKSRKFGKLLG